MTTQAKFSPGQVVATPGVLEAFERTGDGMIPFLVRHLRGDWGDLDEHDKQENEFSLTHGLRLLSAYTLSDGTEYGLSPKLTAHQARFCFLRSIEMEEQQVPYEVRVLVDALEMYMETDVCICEVQPCPENCDRCMWCIGAFALARNGIEAPRKVVRE